MNKQLKGLKNGGIVNFKCNSCDQPLLVLQLVKTNNDKSSVLTRIAVQCGLCGGCSDVKQISGQFYSGAPNDQMLIDISNDSIDGLETDILFISRSK